MATTYRFGLLGIGSNVQYGRRGGYIEWTGSVFRSLDNTLALAQHRVATTPVDDNDAASKAYVDAFVQGLSPKDAARAATTATPGDLGGSFVANVITIPNAVITGYFPAGQPLTIDGITMTTNDRVLVKDQTLALENGIYVVTDPGQQGTTDAVLTRATDADAATELAAAFCFVSEGTVHVNEGFVSTFADTDIVNTDPVNWVQFSAQGAFTASDGVQLVGSDFRLDIPGLPTAGGSITGADLVAVYDNTPGAHRQRTWTDVIADLGLATGGSFTGGLGIDVSGGTISFEKGTVVPIIDAPAGSVSTADEVVMFDNDAADLPVAQTWSQIILDLGLVTTAGGNSLTAGVGIGITGSTISIEENAFPSAAIATVDRIMFFDDDNSNAPTTTTLTNFINNLNIVSTSNIAAGNGILVQTSTGVFEAKAISVSGAGNLAGLAVSNADGTAAGNPTIGLDIQNLLVRPAVVSADRVPVWDSTNDQNVYYTISDIAGALASVNSFETWAGGGNTTGDANIQAASATDTANLVGGDGINVDISNATDTITLSFVQAGINSVPVAPADEVVFFDNDDSNNPKRNSWTNVISNLSLVTTTTVGSSLTAGIGIDAAALATGTVAFSDNLMTAQTADLTDELVIFNDPGGTNTPAVTTVANFLTDRDIRTGTVAVADGGTGVTSFGNDAVLVTNGSGALAPIAVGAPGQDQFVAWNDGLSQYEFRNISTIAGGAAYGQFTLTGNTGGASADPVAVNPSEAIGFIGGTGVQLTGVNGGAGADTLTFEFFEAGFATPTVATDDRVVFFDNSASGAPATSTWTNIISNLNIVAGGNITGGTGILVQTQTGPSVFEARAITLGGAGLEGLSLVNGDGILGDPVIGLDITGLTVDNTLVATDEFVYHNGTNNRKIAASDLATQLASVGSGSGAFVIEGSWDNTDGPGPINFGAQLPDNGRVMRVRVVVDTAFNTGMEFAIEANGGGTTVLMPATDNDAEQTGIYETDVDYRNTSGFGQDLRITYTAGSITAGVGRVYVEYFPGSGT